MTVDGKGMREWGKLEFIDRKQDIGEMIGVIGSKLVAIKQ